MKDEKVAEAETEVFRLSLMAHAERQTKALETIATYFMRLIAVLTLLALVVVVAWLSS